jgi:HK97 family phage prohead protease
MHRAYSRIELKSLNDSRRTFSGIASTPTPDRMGDIVDPDGAVYKLPIPLLWQHQSDKPIGEITDVRATKSGIVIRGEVFRASESKTLMERLDEAWESIKLGLVKGLSIGFSPLEASPLKDKSGGIHFQKWDWHELSAVTIPANTEASITAIKSMDRKLLAASGKREGVVWLGDPRRVRRNVVYLSKTSQEDTP